VLIVQADAVDIESNELIFRTTSSLFIRGIGGFGNKGTVKIKIPKAPKRPADNTSEELTQPN
jgi:3-hydroxyacyl-CoA dehydrogenase/3a,7a,12a-trihydroxy-5b-cholest-24-enoyl-CoA hydratase/multifunctional beta-oxidation protein/peroxisomal enoyl-CoA hydratase 2